MSTTQTSHEPNPDELAHAAPDTGHDDHGHDGETLGPIDVLAWGALALGVAAGLVVAFCLLVTTTLLAPAAAV